VSSKLRDVGPEQLATSEGLREGVQRMLGGEATTPGMQATVRPGCVHLVVDALTFKVWCLLIRPPWVHMAVMTSQCAPTRSSLVVLSNKTG
jgi:hypothetical protein